MRSTYISLITLIITGFTLPAAAQNAKGNQQRDTVLKNYLTSMPVLRGRKDGQTAATIPINLATCRYGVFCREELKLDKVTPLKVRFRLGSAQQNDWLEGKPGAIHP